MHEWTKPKFCMPLPGEIVVVRVAIGHTLVQLPITVQRARNRWCNAETGKILEHEVRFWRSPTLEEVGVLENEMIEVADSPPAQTRSPRSDQSTPNFRVDPSTLFKLQALAAAAHAPPPPPIDVPEEPKTSRTGRPILGAARPVAARRAVLHAHPFALRHPVTMRPRAPEPEFGYRHAHGGPVEAQVIRTRFVPRTMR